MQFDTLVTINDRNSTYSRIITEAKYQGRMGNLSAMPHVGGAPGVPRILSPSTGTQVAPWLPAYRPLVRNIHRNYRASKKNGLAFFKL